MLQVRSRPLRWTRRLSCRASAFAVAATAILSIALPVFAQDESAPSRQQPAHGATEIAAGKTDFVKHCAPCHGNNAKGHGPEVNLIPGIKPPDLTKLSK